MFQRPPFYHKPGVSADSQNPWSAHLDRFYISHSEADLTVIKPVVVSNVHTFSSLGDRGINSHVPTSLHFFLRRKSTTGPRRISESTMENAKFVPYTKKLWNEALASHPDANPLEKIQIFNEAMMGASKQIFIKMKSIRLFSFKKLFRSTSPLVCPLMLRFSVLPTTPPFSRSFPVAAKDSVPPSSNRLLTTRHDISPKVEPVNLDQPLKKKSNALKELKLKLPSTRSKIQALRVGPDNSTSSDPSDIGRIIQDYCGNLASR
jgi:hypothetical protein